MRGQVKDALKSISDRWFLNEPLLFGAYCAHKLIPNINMECAMRSGQRRIEYNPVWLSDLNELEISELLRREVIRIILKHPYARQPVNAIPEILFAASNVTIYEHGGTSIAPNLWEDVDLPHGLSFEEYYNLLAHKLPPQPPVSGFGDQSDSVGDEDGGDGDGPADGNNEKEKEGNGDKGNNSKDDSDGQSANGEDREDNEDGDSDGQSANGEDREDNEDGDSNGQSGDGNGPGGKGKSGNRDFRPKSLRDIIDNGTDATALWDEDELQTEYINGLIENAMLTNQWGSVPGHLKDLIKASTVKSDNVRRKLDMFRTSIISTNRRLTRMRPSRRYGWTQMGVLHPYTSKLLIAIDTSGSIDGDDLKRFFGLVNSFFTYGIPQIDVLQFDADLHLPLLPLHKAIREIEAKGGGGTCFQPPVDYFVEHKEYDGMLVLTDGYAPDPKLPINRKILWILRDLSCYNDCTLQPKVYI